MNIPFIKAHGARNDFLLSWRDQLPPPFSHEPANDAELAQYAAAARAICERNTGAGADGWLLVSRSEDRDGAADGSADCSIDLWNSDGSRSEISGNGTRCAAALLVDAGHVRSDVRIATGAGIKSLQLLDRQGRRFSFEMNMGRPKIEQLHVDIGDVERRDANILDATILNVGNPQCVFFVRDFDFDWAALGAHVERLPRFPQRTNVSFVRVVDRHTIETRFFERGAGVTMSSGTGSTGAGAAAWARGLVESPLCVETPAGPLHLRWYGPEAVVGDEAEILLAGPSEIVARGEFYFDE